MKKLFLYIPLILFCCNLINTANAEIKKHAGLGELHLSEKIIDGYFDYATKPLNKLPLVFFITEDKNDFYSVVINNDGGSYAGSVTITKKKSKCELKLKKKCNLFSNTNMIVWDNGINPSDPEKSSGSIKNMEKLLKVDSKKFTVFESGLIKTIEWIKKNQ